MQNKLILSNFAMNEPVKEIDLGQLQFIRFVDNFDPKLQMIANQRKKGYSHFFFLARH